MNQQEQSQQTQFVHEQEVYQPPPELTDPEKQAEQAIARAKRRKIFIIGGIFIAVLVVLAASVVTIGTVFDQNEVMPTPTVTPSPPQQSSAVKAELERLQQIVEAADPDGDAFPPPPVDMQVEF